VGPFDHFWADDDRAVRPVTTTPIVATFRPEITATVGFRADISPDTPHE